MAAQIGMTALFAVLILPALFGLANAGMRSNGNRLVRLLLMLAPLIGGFYFLTWVW